MGLRLPKHAKPHQYSLFILQEVNSQAVSFTSNFKLFYSAAFFAAFLASIFHFVRSENGGMVPSFTVFVKRSYGVTKASLPLEKALALSINWSAVAEAFSFSPIFH